MNANPPDQTHCFLMHSGYLLLLTLPALATAFRIWAFAREDGEVRVSIWDCVVDQITAVATYGLFGPPLGLLPFLLVELVMDIRVENASAVVLLLMLSYPFGAIPAVVTAAVVGALRPWLRGWRALWVSCGAGALLSLAWAVPAALAGNLGNTAFITVCGAIGGLACARIWFGAPGKASS